MPKEFTVTVTVKVSERLCADILTTAVEAGTHGSRWLRAYDSTAHFSTFAATDAVSPTPVRLVTSIELGNRRGSGDENVPAERKTINCSAIAAALGSALDPAGDNVAAACQCLSADLDGPSADAIVQLAVFDAVVYG